MIKFKDIFKEVIFILDIIDWLNIYYKPNKTSKLILKISKTINPLLRIKYKNWQKAFYIALNNVYLKKLKENFSMIFKKKFINYLAIYDKI